MEDRLRASIEERLRELGWPLPAELVVERPRDPAHGDWSTNVALALAKPLRRAPRAIAEELAAGWEADPELVAAVTVAGPGFVNFRLRSDFLTESLRRLLHAPESYLRSNAGRGRPVIVEFVSSNPTGPLHIGHGRNAALGDAVASLLEASGYAVTREYYFNDAGRQMDILALSLLARYAELTGGDVQFPADGYEGEYLIDLARDLRREHGDQLYDPSNPDAALTTVRRFATERMVQSIQHDLEIFGVRFDAWFNESRLYDERKLDETLARLRERGAVYEREGAVWFRASSYGDGEDRVLVKSTGQPTYFLPDIAYHADKHDRGFVRAIDVLGADHHGYVPRLQAALRALGYETEWLHCIIYQAVTLLEGGEAVKLSTRKARFVTLRELVEEVGADVARYFFLMRRADTHLNFDLDVARSESEENPVYYIQYAHARVASVFAKLAETRPDLLDGAGKRPEGARTRLRASGNGSGARGLTAASLADADLDLLREPREIELLRLLADFPALVAEAAAAREPHRMAVFLERLAKEFHVWYHDVRILVEEDDLARARLALAAGVQVAIREGLRLLGIQAPEAM